MAEWLILLVLVPAIVVPVVLLVGFAGCRFVPGVPPTVVTIDSAVGKSVNTITLTWHSSSSVTQTFEIERTHPNGSVDPPFGALASPFDDTGLPDPGSYKYRVRSVFLSDGTISSWSTQVTGTTLAFKQTFAQDLTGSAASDEGGWEGYTLVQRIEAAALMASGRPVTVTLYASSTSAAHIDRIYISQPDPAPGAHPYDSFTDITKVWDISSDGPLVIPAASSVTLPLKGSPPINYSIQAPSPNNPGQALLVAVDFSSTPGSGIRYVAGVASTRAKAYWRLGGTEAAVQHRSANYQPDPVAGSPRIYLVGDIEAGEVA
jgi:hypothetical protein